MVLVLTDYLPLSLSLFLSLSLSLSLSFSLSLCYFLPLSLSSHRHGLLGWLSLDHLTPLLCVVHLFQRYLLSRARSVCVRGGEPVPPNMQWLLHSEGHGFLVRTKPADTSTASILSTSVVKGWCTLVGLEILNLKLFVCGRSVDNKNLFHQLFSFFLNRYLHTGTLIF